MRNILKALFLVTGLSVLAVATTLVYAGSFSDSANGSPGTNSYKSGSVTVPTGATCQYFGSFISDGHNPPGTAYIYGPLGYDTITTSGHSNPADLNPTPISAGTYGYTLEADGMAYCGLAIGW